jgi:hypothetical protein
MPNTKKCNVSDELFSGFTIDVDLDYYYNTDELCKYVQDRLISSLDNVNLTGLASIAKQKKFHIHDKDIYKLRVLKSEEVVWICSHCNTIL